MERFIAVGYIGIAVIDIEKKIEKCYIIVSEIRRFA